MKYIALMFAILFVGCEAHKVPTPSTAAVQGSVNKAHLSNQEAQRLNDINATDASLIDAKAAVIHKYWDKSQ